MKNNDGNISEYIDENSLPDHNLEYCEDDVEERKSAPDPKSGGGAPVLDELTTWDSDEEDEFDAYQREQREASWAVRKHKMFDTPLPLLAGLLREFPKDENWLASKLSSV